MNYETTTIDADGRLLTDGTPPPPSRRRRWVIAGVVVLLGALLAWYLLRPKPAEVDPLKGEGARATQVPSISVAVPGRDTVRTIISGTGSLAARREMPIGVVGEGGLVTRVLVEPGSWVRAGQVLATVDRSVQAQTAESLAAQVRVARADAEIAESELRRAQQLVDRGFISKADVERRTATRDAARARVAVAEATLGETRARNRRLDIRAPADGLVLTRAVEPGQIVGAGQAVLFRIAMNGQMEMRAQLAESDLARVRTGAPAEVTPVGSTTAVKGEVWQVSPVIDPQSRQGIARIALPYSESLRPGGFASAQIVAGAAVAPQLPESAVLSDGQGNFVYVVDAKDQVQRRAVRIGEVSDGGVSIASGLDGTERVVLSAGGFLAPGQKVKPTLVKIER
ncbi:efflux transporter periplasmic adaptor subunit [Sphingomonas spermidinifaciens]|uniref:Efflux transporter periplasmic adaptor subunit n=1 Tax=Sphingomonas spermidinifaciens TaxID=1141889 RepID=A0A2A4B4F0_9SPHN|nr:efflux RND transporter periplasmic adaptor subunit [Sphingomonas spermidinifaciens]PCD04073.1 efflux transporter periplasmic adaptor subunit [Sphingomonas spermidinifaciens]